MRRKLAGGLAGLALALPILSGCNHTPVIRDRANPAAAAQTDRTPDAASLVNYMNLNAKKVQNVRAQVDVACRQGRQDVGVGGRLACAKPRDFRLQASVVGRPAVDIGSNNDEFWYWISQANPPYVYHCSYRDLSTGKVNVPFPFQPDMIVAALGMAEYDEAAKYEVRVQPRTVELVQDTTAPTGQPVRRITVFNRSLAQPGQPQVLAHVLQDKSGKLICRATVERVTTDASGAVLPTAVKIEWPAQELTMRMKLSDIETNRLAEGDAGRLFQRAGLTGHDSFDLATRQVDTPGAVRRAGATALPRR